MSLQLAIKRSCRHFVGTTRPSLSSLLWPFVPACITFGPLFMTKINGTASPEASEHLVSEGTLMLSIGLIGMFLFIQRQQKTIEKLQARLGSLR
jgi:hypothetical protein